MDLESRATEPFIELAGLSSAGCYEPYDDGLYFIERQASGSKLKRVDYQTREITDIVNLLRPADPVNCFALASDRAWLLYSRLDEPEVDLMLVDDFP